MQLNACLRLAVDLLYGHAYKWGGSSSGAWMQVPTSMLMRASLPDDWRPRALTVSGRYQQWEWIFRASFSRQLMGVACPICTRAEATVAPPYQGRTSAEYLSMPWLSCPHRKRARSFDVRWFRSWHRGQIPILAIWEPLQRDPLQHEASFAHGRGSKLYECGNLRAVTTSHFAFTSSLTLRPAIQC